MEITGKTLLHLNYTSYFDDEGYEHDSLEDARNASFEKMNTVTVRRQNCYMKEWDEMSYNERDSAEFVASTCEPDSKPEEFMYVFGATSGNLLFMSTWTELQRLLNNGAITVVEKKRN